MSSGRSRRLILITGPAGSGKTTLAERIARNPNWVHVSEDAYWVRIKSGHPPVALRTREEQDVVQAAVVRDVRNLLAEGNDVVLEFILYEDPPRPLIFYRERLGEDGADVFVRALRPDAATIAERMTSRGRAHRSDNESAAALHQLASLDSRHIDRAWIVDNSALTIEQTYDAYVRAIVE